ncbi:UNVERIFIED_CONTAM: hypothetical protein Sangu_1310800 [Sesamum angustifolium]|uniref:Integrase catalytic domain-containing protein n=1 Tax=Sesamum angustifolium TaxID=2727405 RepID=A0AAW2NL88_9LAMI
MAVIRSRKINFISLEKTAIEEPEEIICIDPTLLSWKEEIIRFLTNGIQPENKKDAKVLRRKAFRFIMIDGELYKHDFSQPFLKCLTPEEGNYVLREIHEGICRNHLGGKALARKSLRQGFYWPTIFVDAHELVKRCCACQEHTSPLSHGTKKVFIVAVDYFTKWVEAEPLAKISEKEVIKFLWRNIVCCFSIPRTIIFDNGTQFSGNKLKEWCKELAIKQFFTSVNNPQVNGQTEVTNRTILQYLKMLLGTDNGAWVDELPGVLWAYRTTSWTTTRETPFSLSYGTEAIATAEIGELSWRVKYYDLEANEQGLRMNLDFVEEVREEPWCVRLCIKPE